MGGILILLSGIILSIDSYFGKLTLNSTSMSGAINSFSRFLFGLLFMLLYMLIKGKSLRPNNIKPIIVRAFINSIELLIFAMGIQYSTITNVNMLHMTYPVFVILFAPLITGEKVSKDIFIYMFLVILGSYIVINPKFNSINIGDVFALLSAILGAISILYLTKATRNNDTDVVLFYVMLFGMIFNLPFAIRDILNFETVGIGYIILGSVSALLGQMLMTIGYKYVDTPTGSLISSSRIVASAIIGILLLREPFNLRIGMGIILIILALGGTSGFFSKNKLS